MVKRVAVLTSGGDAPGMNAAIRAVVRSGIACGWETYGVQLGYTGLIEGRFTPFDARVVGGIIGRGGTILGSARCAEFKTEAGQKQALDQLSKHDINALIVIGGNGSQSGAASLAAAGFPVVGIASTIDNDLVGSDVTIGVDTALNVALEAIDRLKVTASSHLRAFLVEVMGRNSGYLALMAGIAGGAEAVLIPEIPTSPEQLETYIRVAYERGKTHAIIVVAEGAAYNAETLIHYFREHNTRLGFDLRAVTLGHVQRGGTPTAYDRILATELGSAAINVLAENRSGVLVGKIKSAIAETRLDEVVGKQKPISPNLFHLANVMNI